MHPQLSDIDVFHEEARIFRDPALQRRFLADGFVVVDFLEPSQVEKLWDVWLSNPGDLSRLAFSSTVFSRDLDYRRTMHEYLIAEMEGPAQSLLDAYRLGSCGFITKQPGKEEGVVELHQDPTMVDDTRFIALGIWCPLVDVDLQNGCLRVVPGSHRINRRPREAMVIDFPYEELLRCIQNKYLADIPMKAGQAFIYTQTLFHSSLPNYSDKERLVAGSLALPEGSHLRIYVRDEDKHPGLLAGYEVSDDYYRTYCLGTVPDENACIGFVEDKCEPLSEERLHEVLGSRLVS